MEMFSAFLIDPIELSCRKVFQAALAQEKKLSWLRERIRSLFTEVNILNW